MSLIWQGCTAVVVHNYHRGSLDDGADRAHSLLEIHHHITHIYNLRYNNSDKDGDLIASNAHAHTTDPFNFKQALLRTFAGVLTVQENLDLYDS